MNTRSLLFSLTLVAASGVQAQSLPVDAGSLSARPQNLSQRPAKALAGAGAASILPEQGAQATDPAPEQAPMTLPYGAGFESRQLGSTPGSHAGSAGRTGGSAGAGGSGNSGAGGRGGSGRGR